MRGKHRKKAPRFLVFRGIVALILALAFSVSSFVTVMANTVSANVIDGDQSYTFSMNNTDLDSVLAQAEGLGLKPLGPLDVAEWVENTTTIYVRRGVSLTVKEAGKETHLVAYRGDTVQKTLESNNILLKDNDSVSPTRNTVIKTGTPIEIRRSCRVVVFADGQKKELVLVGGTVADALNEAGLTLNGRDSANYELDEPLFDNMRIRVSRTKKVKITADGKTGEYQVSAETVGAALKKCGIALSDDDRLNVDRKAKLEDDMHIVVTRVEVKEVVEKEEVPYPVQYVTSDEMYEDETQVKTAGVLGEKEVTYKLSYVAGKLDKKEAVSEKVVKEPVPEVVVKGTKVREEDDSSGNHYTEGYNGTFVDADGNVVPYAKMLVGECTAACIPGGTTSIGLPAEYGIIAVDPDIIPYGTRMYVVSPDGSVVYGYGVAGDTGGAMLSGQVLCDLYYNTVEECSIIGRRDMVVYILP